jgi:Zn-dependent alcohol dehydrogenase
MQDDFPDGVDYAFDAVGDPETTKAAFRWTRNGGLCVIVGLPAAGARLELDPTEFIRREKRLTGTIYGSEDPAVALPVLVGHVRSGALDLRSQLGPRFSLDDANDAVEAALAGVPGRVLVVP